MELYAFCWHVVSTGYFYVLFLWAIAASDYRALEIYKNLGLPLSLLQQTATQITISVNIFVSNIIQYEISFFIKIHVKVLTKVFYIQIWFKCETQLLFFLIRTMVYRKKIFTEKNSIFAVDYVEIIELHIVHTRRHMQSEWMK